MTTLQRRQLFPSPSLPWCEGPLFPHRLSSLPPPHPHPSISPSCHTFQSLSQAVRVRLSARLSSRQLALPLPLSPMLSPGSGVIKWCMVRPAVLSFYCRCSLELAVESLGRRKSRGAALSSGHILYPCNDSMYGLQYPPGERLSFVLLQSLAEEMIPWWITELPFGRGHPHIT